MRIQLIVATLSVSLAGCLEIHPQNGAYSCKTSSDCPANYYCAPTVGTCWQNGAVPPGKGKGGGGDDGGTPGGGNDADMSLPVGGDDMGPTMGNVPSAAMSTFVITPDAPPLVANGRSRASLKVVVANGAGVPVPKVKVSFSTSDALDFFMPASALSDGTGTVSSGITSDDGGTRTVTALVEYSGGSFMLTQPITFQPFPLATNSQFSANYTHVAADGSMKTTLTLLVRDGNQNPVPNASVKLSIQGGASAQDTLTQMGTSTAGDGTLKGALVSTLAGTKKVLADVTIGNDPSNGFTKEVDLTFDPVPSATTSNVAISGSSIPADGASTGSFTVTIKDANNTDVVGAMVQVNASDGQTTIKQDNPTTGGDGTVTGTVTSISAGDKTITAQVSWSVDGVTGSFPLSSAPQKLHFTAVPSAQMSRIDFNVASALANSHDSVAVTITVNDFSGAHIANLFPSLSQTGGNDVSFIQPVSPTTSSGTTTGSMTANAAGAKTITATVAGISFSKTFTFSQVTVDHLGFSALPPATTGHNLPTVKVQAYDTSNIVITTRAVPITIAATPVPTTFGGTHQVNTSGANGEAQFTDLTIYPAGTYQLVASTNLDGVNKSITSPGPGFQVQDAQVPPFTMFKAVADGSNVNLSWDNLGATVTYQLYRKGPKDADFTTTIPSFTATSTTAGVDKYLTRGSYTYHVIASAPGEQPSQSPDITVTPAPEVCITYWNGQQGQIWAYAIPADGSAPKLMRTINTPASGATTADGKATGMSYPYGIAVNASAGEIYVINYLPMNLNGNANTFVLNVFSRTAESKTGAPSPLRAMYLTDVGSGPQGIALNGGELVIADNDSGRVGGYQIPAATGTVAASWYVSGGQPQTNISSPLAVAVEPSGATTRVFVQNSGNKVISFLENNLNGHDVNAGGVTTLNNNLSAPEAMAIDHFNHELLVTNESLNTVARFNSSTLANSSAVFGEANIANPVGIAFEDLGKSSGGNMYILNQTTGTVTKYNSHYATGAGADAKLTGLPVDNGLNAIAICN